MAAGSVRVWVVGLALVGATSVLAAVLWFWYPGYAEGVAYRSAQLERHPDAAARAWNDYLLRFPEGRHAAEGRRKLGECEIEAAKALVSRRAQDDFHAGRYDTARKELKEGLKQYPDEANTLLQLAALTWGVDQIGYEAWLEADNLTEKALKVAPGNAVGQSLKEHSTRHRPAQLRPKRQEGGLLIVNDPYWLDILVGGFVRDMSRTSKSGPWRVEFWADGHVKSVTDPDGKLVWHQKVDRSGPGLAGDGPIWFTETGVDGSGREYLFTDTALIPVAELADARRSLCESAFSLSAPE